MLNRAVDLGVNLIDTAPSYGLSEERIGRHLSWRRHELVLSTKGGYGTRFPDWTAEAIAAGVEQACRRMRTDRVDLFHLHSCPLETLQHDDILEACRQIVRGGKARVAAYSGENEALQFAVDSGVFQSVQCSMNVCDQRALDGAIARASRKGIGVIAKRPLANAPWTGRSNDGDTAAAEYRERFRALALDPGALGWDELFLRFAAFAPGVTSCIAGTRQPANVERNVAAVERGPLPPSVVDELREAFLRADRGWVGRI